MSPVSSADLPVNDADVTAVRSLTIPPKHVAIVYVGTKANGLLEIRTYPLLDAHGCLVANGIHYFKADVIFRIYVSNSTTKIRPIPENMRVALASCL